MKVLVVIAIVLVSVLANPQEEDEGGVIGTFVNWLAENGVKYESEVGLLDPMGVVATGGIEIDPIEKKQNIVTIPENIALHSQTVLSSTIKHIFTENPNIKGTSKIAVFLLHEKNNPESFWKPYIDSLPEVVTPMFWSKENRDFLRGSWVLDRTVADELSIEADYKQVFEETLFKKYPEIFSPLVYSLEEYKWSWGTIWSRAFYFESVGLVLVPMLDSFAHTNGARSEISHDDGVFKLLVKDKYKEEEEIFINRGVRSNNDLLRLYGYILSNNEHNIAFIDGNLKETDPHFKIKEELLEYHQLWSPPYPYGDSPQGLWVKKEVPLHVIAYFRIKFWRPTTRQIKEYEDSGKLPTFNPKKQIDEENEKQAVQGLVKAIEDQLNKFPQSYKDDKTIMDKGGLTTEQQIAVRVRYQEKKILNEARGTLMRPLSFDKTIL